MTCEKGIPVSSWGRRGDHSCVFEMALGYSGVAFLKKNALVMGVDHELESW